MSRCSRAYSPGVRNKMIKMSALEATRFWDKVNVNIKKPCWFWMGERNEKGYGRVWLNGFTKRAHRIAYSLVVGRIPAGMWVLHHCDQPPCVNPEHLYLGTVKENGRDAKERGCMAFGERHTFAKLNNAKVRQIRHLYALTKGSIRAWSHLKLARRFGVSKTTIGHTLIRKCWSHVK